MLAYWECTAVFTECLSYSVLGHLRVFFNLALGNSLVVQWLRFHTSTVGNMGSIPSQRTSIAQAARLSQKNILYMLPSWH